MLSRVTSGRTPTLLIRLECIVRKLRKSTEVTNNLAREISDLSEELAADCRSQVRPELHVQVEGLAKDLVPVLRDDVYRIAGEALRNSIQPSDASRIEVEILYGGRHFHVRIRDNGKGISPHILEAGRRAGHYGLPGMDERSKLIGGRLDMRSQPDSGTEVDLSIPASVAYAKSDATPKS